MEPLELYIPKLEDLWFYQKMMSDPETMSYNAGWDVEYDGYHRDTGCIDYPDEVLADWYDGWIGKEPDRFYAYIKRSSDGAWIGDVCFHYTPEKDWWDMGIVIYAPYRGKGYAVPALKLLLDRAFRVCGISRIHNDFEVARNEAAAWETHRKAGFKELGVEEGFLQMMITKEEYLETTNSCGGKQSLRKGGQRMDYKIRFATLEDHDLIYALKAESVRPYVEKIWGWDDHYQRNDFDRDFAAIQQFHVIEADGRFVGFVQYYAEGLYFEVVEIHLLPEYRGSGIGSDILRNLQKVCIAQDRKIRIGCFKENHRAKALYQKLGFRQTEETDTHYILEYPNYTIIPYDEKYRDDMIFMVLEAKNALGRVPRLNDDLLDVKKNYIDTGDMFWLAIDEHDRVIGCVGYNSIPETTEVKLHRLYIKATRKRQGIGTRLLHTAELHLREQGKTVAYAHLGGKEYFESRSFYPKHGYTEHAADMMMKKL